MLHWYSVVAFLVLAAGWAAVGVWAFATLKGMPDIVRWPRIVLVVASALHVASFLIYPLSLFWGATLAIVAEFVTILFVLLHLYTVWKYMVPLRGHLKKLTEGDT